MKFFFMTPLVVFLLFLMVMAAKLLDSDSKQTSVLVGKPLPEFNIPYLNQEGSLSNNDFKGEYRLINIFGSWCLTCKIEHPFLMKIANENKLPIYGINWRDDEEKAEKWLEKNGNPYKAVGVDNDGSTIIKLGVTGAPENFLISPDGIILYRYSGVLTENILNDEILPLLQ